jgi:hypothetical protein
MNQLDRLRHAIHLQAYISTAQSEPFPLDGSEWARLVSMRVSSKDKPVNSSSCTDFWQRVHSEETPVHRERKSTQQGIQHWFAGNSADASSRKASGARFSELRSLWHGADDFRQSYSPADSQPSNLSSPKKITNDVNKDGIRFLTVQPECI